MPRKLLIRSDLHAYHVYSRSNNREQFYLPLPELWPLFLRQLERTKKKFPFEIYNFVLMNNHYHLLLRTPNRDLDKIMHDFNHKLSLEILRTSGRINKVFGGRYKWSLINSQIHLLTVFRYIYQNPLRKKLVDRVEDYPFSSFTGRGRKLVTELDFISADQWKLLDVNLEDKNEVSKGLKKSIYRPNSTRKY